MSAPVGVDPQASALIASPVRTERGGAPGEYDRRSSLVVFDFICPEGLLLGGARNAASLLRSGGTGNVQSTPNFEHRAQLGISREHRS